MWRRLPGAYGASIAGVNVAAAILGSRKPATASERQTPSASVRQTPSAGVRQTPSANDRQTPTAGERHTPSAEVEYMRLLRDVGTAHPWRSWRPGVGTAHPWRGWRPDPDQHPGPVGHPARGWRPGAGLAPRTIWPIRAGPLHSGQWDASCRAGFTSCYTACLCWYPKRCRQTFPRRRSIAIPATRPRTRIA